MIEGFIAALESFPRGLAFVVLGLVVLVIAKLVRDLITRYRVNEEITEKRNLAVALRLSGYFLGVILIFLGALYQPLTLVYQPLTLVGPEGLGFDLGFDRDFAIDLLRVFLYSLAGIVALNLVMLLMDRLVLYQFNVEKEIIEDQNVGTGAAEFGMYVAVGLLVAGSVAGESAADELTGALIALAFFGMGLVLLIVFALFYEWTTSFDIHSEIEGDNIAVGVALGGNLVAIGLVTLKAVFGEFVGWGESIAAFLVFGVLGFVLLYVMRLLIDLVILPTVKVADALSSGRNVGVAFVESAVVISAALVLFVAI